MIVKQSITLEVYKKSNGKCPFIEWLAGLQDKKARHRIQARLDRISLGNFGDCEPIGQGAFELRFFFGSGYRVYFGYKDNCVVLLLLGGDKSSQKEDIKKALHYWSDYQNEVDYE